MTLDRLDSLQFVGLYTPNNEVALLVPVKVFGLPHRMTL